MSGPAYRQTIKRKQYENQQFCYARHLTSLAKTVDKGTLLSQVAVSPSAINHINQLCHNLNYNTNNGNYILI